MSSCAAVHRGRQLDRRQGQRADAAAWDKEWERVEPQWSGRITD
jgi:hypothetical protein